MGVDLASGSPLCPESRGGGIHPHPDRTRRAAPLVLGLRRTWRFNSWRQRPGPIPMPRAAVLALEGGRPGHGGARAAVELVERSAESITARALRSRARVLALAASGGLRHPPHDDRSPGVAAAVRVLFFQPFSSASGTSSVRWHFSITGFLHRPQ